jgi:hypothetical protein
MSKHRAGHIEQPNAKWKITKFRAGSFVFSFPFLLILVCEVVIFRNDGEHSRTKYSLKGLACHGIFPEVMTISNHDNNKCFEMVEASLQVTLT